MLNSDDCNVFDSTFSSFLLELVIDLSAAVEHFFDLIVCNEISCRVFKDSLESEPSLKVFNIAGRSSELEQLFGDWNNQRLAERPANLSTQEMEVLGCSRAVI